MPPKQFRETVDVRLQSLSTGEASVALTLADKLEQFSSIATMQAGEEAIRRGQETAAQVQLAKKEGLTQTPAFQEEGFIGGIEAKAHNKALRSAYMASIDTDIRAEVGRISAENQSDITSFNDAVGSFRKGLVESVDPLVRQAVSIDADRVISFARAKVQANTVRRQNDEARAEIVSSADSLSREAFRNARNGDIEEAQENTLKSLLAIDSMVESGFMSKDKAEGAKREILREVGEQEKRRELDLISDESIKDANEKISEWTKEVPKGWSPDEWQTFTTSAQQELNRKENRLRQELKVVSKEVLLAESVSRGIQFTDPSIPADPAKGSQDRKDINNAYAEMSVQWQSLPPQEQFQKNVEFIKNTGIFPDLMTRNITATMRSGTTDQAVAFSSLVDQISKDPQSANILKDVPSDSRAIAMQISDSLSIGLSPEDSVLIARETTFGQTAQDKERISLEMENIKPDLPGILDDMVDEAFDPDIWTMQPDVTPQFQAEFNVAMKKFMVKTGGNPDQSARLAFDALQKTWGRTEIGGNRLMKHPVENYYAVKGVDNDWISKQFKKDVRTELKLDPKNVTVVPRLDATTGGVPTYMIMTKDAQGRDVAVLSSDNEPTTFTPKFEGTMEERKLGRKKAKKTEQAKEARQRLKDMQRIMHGLPKEDA